MGSVVRVIPLSDAEMRTAFTLLELVTWELGDAELETLADIGLERRRVYVVRDATGAWLYDAIEGDPALITLGPEAVWATSASSIDRWIAARDSRAYVGDLESLPIGAATLDLRCKRREATTSAKGSAAIVKLAVVAPEARGLS
jgi:formyltetrahydrofolate synthetase